MKRRILLIILPGVVVVGGALAGWWFLDRDDSGGGTVTVYGNVEIRDAQLAFNEQEHVAEVFVEEGDSVEPGLVLARLQDDRLRAQLAEACAGRDAQRQVLRRLINGTRKQEIEQARAEVAAAEVRVANAKRLFDRLERTAGTGAISEQTLDDARAELELARAERDVRREALELAEEGTREEEIAEAKAKLEALEARVKLFENRLEDTVLRSPSHGVIQSRILEVGEMAAPTRPAFVLALSQPKWVRAYLPEPKLGHVREGMPARVTSDSFGARRFSGWVGFISPEAEFTPKSVQTTELRTNLVYEVRVWVEDPRNELRLGMPVTVEVDPNAPPRVSPKPDEPAESAPATEED